MVVTIKELKKTLESGSCYEVVKKVEAIIKEKEQKHDTELIEVCCRGRQ